MQAGVNGFRLNFSHGSYDERREQIDWIRTASHEQGKPVAILQDLQGPKIRLGVLKDNMLTVRAGDMLTLDSSITEHDGSFNLPVQYNLAEKMKVGEPLYMFDGKIKSIVREIAEELGVELVSPRLVDVYIWKKDFGTTIHIGIVTFAGDVGRKVGGLELSGEAGKAEFQKFTIRAALQLDNLPEVYKRAIRKILI